MNLMDLLKRSKLTMPTKDNALPGRREPMPVPDRHYVLGTSLQPDTTDLEVIAFGMGCFWGAERLFWTLDGVVSTAVGYGGGFTPNPTYEEVCTGRTGHNELVRIIYDPAILDVTTLLKRFWENHDPTQGMRQGNDVGTQYRSGIYFTTQKQKTAAQESLTNYQRCLSSQGRPEITTEIKPLEHFYFAEEYHQQYLAKNPQGYCGLGGTGVKYE